MAIEDRILGAGTRLVARYKKQAFVCTVEAGEDGKVEYVLEDGRRFTSPSAAGSAVMGGVACNGWRFWSVEGDAEPAGNGAKPEQPREDNKPSRKGSRMIKRTPNQKGVPEGQVRWFCDACMASFLAEMGAEPEGCPQGHRVDDPQLA